MRAYIVTLGRTFHPIFCGDIILKPYSKIGLLSASLSFNEYNISINDTNDTFETQVTADVARKRTIYIKPVNIMKQHF